MMCCGMCKHQHKHKNKKLVLPAHSNSGASIRMMAHETGCWLVVSVVLVCSTMCIHAAPQLSDEDYRRAATHTPRDSYMGHSAGHSANVLNKHLVRLAQEHGHTAEPCEAWTVNSLNQAISTLIDTATRSGKSPTFRAIYARSNDVRLRRFDSVSAFQSALKAEAAFLAGVSAQSNVTNVLVAGKCYEAALLYAHHLDQEAKASAGQLRVPLLPDTRWADTVQRALQGDRSMFTSEEAAGETLSLVLQTVQDQVVCARCHIKPSVPVTMPVDQTISSLDHQPLAQPQKRVSSNGLLATTLAVGIGRMPGPIQFNTRVYEQGLPGPTLVVQPGDTINVTLQNNLEAPDACRATPAGAGHDTNFYRCPNTTNLHMHGLWVDPQDVYSAVSPGESVQRVYHLSHDHAPGTNWYHPHFHGSVSLQLANGMAGVVIVDDPPNSMPPALEALREHDRVLVFQSVEYFNYTADDVTCPHTANLSRCHNLDGAGSIETIRAFSSDALPLDVTIADANSGNPIPGNYMLINGQYQPIIDMKPGEWQRWRIVNAAHQQSLALAVPGCQTFAIASDGVYLRAPRLKNTTRPLVLAPGARADLVTSCRDGGTFHLTAVGNPDSINFGQQEGFANGVTALVQVSGNRVHMEQPTTLPSLPTYLQDLTHAPASMQRSVEWSLLYMINNTAGLTDVPIYGVNNKTFNGKLDNLDCIEPSTTLAQDWRITNPFWICNASLPTCLTTMNRTAASGSLLDRWLRPISISHGFHLHTFKFQVQNDSNAGTSLDYEPGDWRDTVMTPVAGHVDIRFLPVPKFTGLVPYHCHMSPHSDRGMISVLRVAQVCPTQEARAHANAWASSVKSTLESEASRRALNILATKYASPANSVADAVKAMSSLASSPSSLSSPPWQPTLANYTFNITTSSPKAQELFNEGMKLAFGFARDAAVSFFNQSIQQDGNCAMCYWGVAYASGPFLNHPMCSDARCGPAASYAAKAVSVAKSQQLSTLEQVFIKAIGQRYSDTPTANQSVLFRNYAEALNVTDLPVSDADVGAFYVEAVMLLYCVSTGYNFYDKQLKPYPEIAQATRVLEGHLLDPTTRAPLPPPLQPFAEHLYMHITEPSRSGYGVDSAGRSAGVADRVRQRFNGTQWQHMQHMSGHIYLRTGRYHEVVLVNERAHKSDMEWLQHDLVPYGPGHNVAFLIYGACMGGESKIAVQYGHVLRSIYAAAPDRPDGPAGNQAWNKPLTTFVRFGMWQEILNDNGTMPRNWPYQTVLWHYARGFALLHLGQPTAAQNELDALQSLSPTITGRFAAYVDVANLTLSAAVLFKSDATRALELLKAASDQQLSWPYDEPPDWHLPLRQCVGQVQLSLALYDDAYDTFKADLTEYINNGYSLLGMYTAMLKLPDRFSKAECAAVKALMDEAWKYADIPLSSPCQQFSMA
eukprot:m.101923 g.101923  ORF g.101923 m.101923 type:complete len:1426 (+) comp13213_c0_seq1:24-4301(+)